MEGVAFGECERRLGAVDEVHRSDALPPRPDPEDGEDDGEQPVCEEEHEEARGKRSEADRLLSLDVLVANLGLRGGRRHGGAVSTRAGRGRSQAGG